MDDEARRKKAHRFLQRQEGLVQEDAAATIQEGFRNIRTRQTQRQQRLRDGALRAAEKRLQNAAVSMQQKRRRTVAARRRLEQLVWSACVVSACVRLVARRRRRGRSDEAATLLQLAVRRAQSRAARRCAAVAVERCWRLRRLRRQLSEERRDVETKRQENAAATVVVRWLRRFKAAKLRAGKRQRAVRMQACWRRYKQVLKYRAAVRAARTIQRFAFRVRRWRASVTVHRVVRGWVARRRTERRCRDLLAGELRKRCAANRIAAAARRRLGARRSAEAARIGARRNAKAATVINSRFARFSLARTPQRKEVRRFAAEYRSAARVLQRVGRGAACRFRYRRWRVLRKRRRAKRFAAVALQKRWRGALARARCRKLREVHYRCRCGANEIGGRYCKKCGAPRAKRKEATLAAACADSPFAANPKRRQANGKQRKSAPAPQRPDEGRRLPAVGAQPSATAHRRRPSSRDADESLNGLARSTSAPRDDRRVSTQTGGLSTGSLPRLPRGPHADRSDARSDARSDHDRRADGASDARGAVSQRRQATSLAAADERRAYEPYLHRRPRPREERA